MHSPAAPPRYPLMQIFDTVDLHFLREARVLLHSRGLAVLTRPVDIADWLDAEAAAAGVGGPAVSAAQRCCPVCPSQPGSGSCSGAGPVSGAGAALHLQA